MLTRRAWLAGAAALLISGRFPRGQEVLVYRSPTCGCCKNWVKHMRGEEVATTEKEVADVTPLKRDLGIPQNLFSCHTAIVGGYFLEGHVPADLARKLLTEKPAALGLAVPGMPMGSPGMEGPTKQAYDVVLLRKDGKTQVFARR